MAENEGSHRLNHNPEHDRDRDRNSGRDGDHGPGDDRSVMGEAHRLRSAQGDRTDHPERALQYRREDQVTPVYEQRVIPARTSAAAVFALVFGLSALLAVLTVILAPLALVLAVIGIILGIIGMRMARRAGVTGRGVAIGGLVLAVIALILSITVIAGVTTVLNNKSAVDRLDKQVQKLRDNLPAKVEVPSP